MITNSISAAIFHMHSISLDEKVFQTVSRFETQSLQVLVRFGLKLQSWNLLMGGGGGGGITQIWVVAACF